MFCRCRRFGIVFLTSKVVIKLLRFRRKTNWSVTSGHVHNFAKQKEKWTILLMPSFSKPLSIYWSHFYLYFYFGKKKWLLFLPPHLINSFHLQVFIAYNLCHRSKTQVDSGIQNIVLSTMSVKSSDAPENFGVNIWLVEFLRWQKISELCQEIVGPSSSLPVFIILECHLFGDFNATQEHHTHLNSVETSVARNINVACNQFSKSNISFNQLFWIFVSVWLSRMFLQLVIFLPI